MPPNDTPEESLAGQPIARIEEEPATAPFAAFSEWSGDADARAYRDLSPRQPNQK